MIRDYVKKDNTALYIIPVQSSPYDIDSFYELRLPTKNNILSWVSYESV